MVKRLEVEARLSISNPRTKTTYGNFTNHGQPHMPRVAISWLRDGISRMIPFSGKCFRMWREAVLCIRTLHAIYVYACIPVCTAYARRRLFTRRMDVCDNGLKHDAGGFQCSSVPVLCLLFVTQKAIASKSKLSLTKIIFLSKEAKPSKNYIYFIF